MKNPSTKAGKDPAFLFYVNDFLRGCEFLTFEETGAYIKLLCHQFNHGHLSERMINICLGGDATRLWEVLKDKFTPDTEGLYFNDRLEYEQKKRAEYSQSRRDNRLSKKGAEVPEIPSYDTTYVNHMSEHMENENEDENKDAIQTLGETDSVRALAPKKSKGKKTFTPPSVEEVIEYFKQNGYIEAGARKAHQHYALANWHDAKGNPVLSWKQKMHTNWFKDEYQIKSNVVQMRQPPNPNNYWNDQEYQEALRKYNQSHAS